MADELVVAGLERADSVMAAQFLLLLADRAVLGAHPAIMESGDVAGTNNNVTKVRRLGLDGYDLMATATEIEDLANTAFTDASTNLTVGRYSLSYDVSTLTVGTDTVLSWPRFAQSLLISAQVTETSLALALSGGFSTAVGSATAEMSLVTFLTAISTLEGADVPGPYLFTGHSSHRRGLRLEQLLGVAGQTQFMAPAGVAINTPFAGTLFGVDMFYSNRAPASGAGKGGMMVGRGAILRGKMTPPVNDPSRQAAFDNILIEYDRDAGKTLDSYHGHVFATYGENDNDRGVEVVCKA